MIYEIISNSLSEGICCLIRYLPATRAAFMEADLQPDKDGSLLDQPGHTRSSSGLLRAWAAYCKELTVSKANATMTALFGKCHLIKCYETGGEMRVRQGRLSEPCSSGHCAKLIQQKWIIQDPPQSHAHTFDNYKTWKSDMWFLIYWLIKDS